MIYRITKYEDCREFVADFDQDPNFSDPMLTTKEQLRNNLIKSINSRKDIVCWAYSKKNE